MAVMMRAAWSGVGVGCVMVAVGAGACGFARGAAGAAVVAVGPETEGVYMPMAMNERGDVLFSYWASLTEEWDGTTPPIQTEVRYADGGVLRLNEPGFLTIDPALLLENGDVVATYSTPGEELPGGGGTVANQEWRLVSRGGDSTVVEGTRAKEGFLDATRAGTLIGNTAASYDWNDEGYVDQVVPLVWSSATGAAELPLPDGFTHGNAFRENPAGGYVGSASEGLWDGAGAYVWWNESGEVAATVDSSVLTSGTANWNGNVGVRGDGALIGGIDDRIFELHPDGTFGYITAAKAELRVYDVNASGVVLGGYLDLAWKYVAWTADGREIDLGAYFVGTGWEISRLVDITDRGDALVEAFRPNTSVSQTFVIRGIPAPGAVVLLGCAAAEGVGRRRRKTGR